jgi:hypothetical protein
MFEQSEKNDFCEKLSNLSEDEIHDAPLIKGMKQSLHIVLESDNDWQVAKTNCNETAETALRLVTTALDRGLITEVSVLGDLLKYLKRVDLLNKIAAYILSASRKRSHIVKRSLRQARTIWNQWFGRWKKFWRTAP